MLWSPMTTLAFSRKAVIVITYSRRQGKIYIWKTCPEDLILKPGVMKLVRYQGSYYFSTLGKIPKWQLFQQTHEVLMEFCLEGITYLGMPTQKQGSRQTWATDRNIALLFWTNRWYDGRKSLPFVGCVLWSVAWSSPSWIIGWHNMHSSRTHYYYPGVSDLKWKCSHGCELQQH